jgi:hypothetical protein
VDAAIAALPEELQAPIILRFLEGRPQTEIAETLGISRKTVRLRIERGVEKIRESLAKQGIVATTTALGVMLESAAAEVAPAALIAELGKRVLATPVPATLGASAGGLTYLFAVAVTTVIVAGGYLLFRGDPPTPTFVEAAGNVGTEVPVPEADGVEVTAELPAVDKGADGGDDVAPEEPTAVAVADPPEEEALGWTLDLTPSDDIAAALAETTHVDLEDIHLMNVMEFLQDSYGISMVYDSRVIAPMAGWALTWPEERFITDGMVRKLNLRDATIEKILTAALTPLNLVYKVRGNVVWVSSSHQITTDLTVPLPSARFHEGEILEQLGKTVNLEFEDIHITEVFGFLTDMFQLPIHVDQRVVAPEGNGEASPPDTQSTYATSGMIPYVNLKDLSAAEALFVMTRLLDLTYRVEKDGVYVSTPARIDQDF